MCTYIFCVYATILYENTYLCPELFTMERLFFMFSLLLSVMFSHATRREDTLSLSITDGLPSNNMSVAMQDPEGYLWIGTGNGLSRYDGYGFVNFYGNDHYATNRMGNVYPDWSSHILWVTSGKGVTGCFDIKQQQFVDYTGCHKTADIYWGTTVAKGLLWQFSTDKGARRIVKRGDVFSMTEYNVANGMLRSNCVIDVKTDDRGNSWILTTKGIVMIDGKGRKRFDVKGDDFVCINTFGGRCLSLSRSKGFIELNDKGKIVVRRNVMVAMPKKVTGNAMLDIQWLIVSDKGMTAYDCKRHSAIALSDDAYMPNGEIVGQNADAVFVANNSGTLLRYARDGRTDRMELIPRHIISYTRKDHFHIATTSNGDEYISTYGSGLFVYQPRSHYLRQLAERPFLVNVFADNGDRIWMLEDHKGMACMKTTNPQGRYTLLSPSSHITDDNSVRAFARSADGALLMSDMRGNVYSHDLRLSDTYKCKVYAMLTDSRRRTWIGTRGDGLWLRGKGRVEAFPCRDVYDIVEDNRGRLWIATSDGLVVMGANGSLQRRQKGTFLHDIETDDCGRMWLASEDGLFIVTPQRTVQFSKRRGTFPSNDILCLRRLRRGGMAVGTSGNGLVICSFDKGKMKHTTLTTDNGLTSNVVNAIEEDRRGRLWVATEEGLSCVVGNEQRIMKFYFANDISGNTYNENASITMSDGSLLFGTQHGVLTIRPDEIATDRQSRNIAITNVSVNGQPLVFSNTLRLAYSQNTVNISFSDFTFIDATSSVYTFRMEGADKEWCQPTSNNSVTYANLPPGKYTFRIKAVGSPQVASLEIVISQPWWNSLWAWIVYVALFITALTVYVVVSRKMRQAKTKLEVERKTTEIKINFFTNIAAELRTPLSLVYGATEKLKGCGSKSTLQALLGGTSRLMRTARQLSLFRELSLERVSLGVERGDIVAFVRHICDEYRAASADGRGNVVFVPCQPSMTAPFDHEKMELMVCGMLSDAINSAGDNDALTVRLSLGDGNTIVISIEANGHEFAPSPHESYTDGIGLYTARRLAELHHGRLTCHAKAYTLAIPGDERAYAQDEWTAAIATPHMPTVAVENEAQGEPCNDCSVMIIGDDTDMVTMMRNHLARYFSVSTTADYAADVAAGYDVAVVDAAKGHDAYATAKAIKANAEERHTAVVMITGSGEPQERLKALNSGADDTVAKPVSLELLVAVVAKHARHDDHAETAKAVVVSDTDIRFKRDLVQALSQHAVEPDFNVAKLAALMHYGQSQLNKKTKELTGHTPLEAIRRERMDYAARQLAEGVSTVAEIADRLGYTNTTRFYHHFRQRFGCSPSQYRKSSDG